MKGITTILSKKKWVFCYLITGLSFWRLDSSDIAQVMMFMIPFVIGADAFDKTKYAETDVEIPSKTE